MKYLDITRFPTLEYAANEAMNTLCTNLSFCGGNVKTLLVTSRYAVEGKSYVSMNLMRSLASLKKRVVVVDADLRRSSIAGQFRLRFPVGDSFGLAHYLAGMCDMGDILYATNLENAYLIPAGREVASSLQLLNSPRLAQLMEYLARSFDVVLVDTPPVGVIVDALELAKYCDGALLVVSYKRGRREEIGEIASMIDKTGCRVLGGVLNNVDFRSFSSRKYYYRSERYSSYYSHRYSAQEDSTRKRHTRSRGGNPK